jgi:hypothetical protein
MRRLPFDFPPPFLVRRLLSTYGLWTNHVCRLQRVCSFMLVIACLPLARLTRRRSRRASWLHHMLTPVPIMFSDQCSYDHPRATTCMGTFDPRSVLARCLGSALLPCLELNKGRPLTLLPLSGSSIRSLPGYLYKRSSGLRLASRFPSPLLSPRLGLLLLPPTPFKDDSADSCFFPFLGLPHFRYGSGLCS